MPRGHGDKVSCADYLICKDTGLITENWIDPEGWMAVSHSCVLNACDFVQITDALMADNQ